MCAQESDQKEESLRHMVREGVMFSIMSGFGEIYLSAYALFLKMTAGQIGFLSAVPALLGSSTQLLSAWIGNRTGHRKRIILIGVTLQALMWIPIMVLPYLFPAHAAVIVLLCIVFYYAANNLAAPLWNSLMGDIVPENTRGRYFGSRSRAMNFANFLALVSGGIVLNYWKDQSLAGVGFLIIFSIAMVARLLSAYQVTRIMEPLPEGRRQTVRSLRRMFHDLRKSLFARFSVFMALMNFSANIAGPFFAVYMLKDLQFSYLEFMMSSAVVVLMQFFTLSNWGRVGDSFGNRRVLAVTAFVIPVLPALWLFTHSFAGIIAIQLLSGVAWAGFNLSASNFVYDAVAPDRRSSYVAAHNVLGSLATFSGAALGAHLSSRLPTHASMFGFHITFAHPLSWLFLLSAIARLNVAVAFVPLLPELRKVQPVRLSVLLWSVTGCGAMAQFVRHAINRDRIKTAALQPPIFD